MAVPRPAAPADPPPEARTGGAGAPPWRATEGGLRIQVKVQPRARRAGVVGLAPAADGGTRLRLAVTEAPEDGRANRAVAALLARALGVPAAAVTVLAGAAAREKLLAVAGDPAVLAPRLAALVAATEGKA